MKITETVFIILAFIALGLNFLSVEGGGFLTVISLMTLSIIYFLFGFALFNNIRFRKIFNKESYERISALRVLGSVGTGVALSTAINGIMYRVQSWTGAEILLITGSIGLLITLIVGIVKYSKTKSEYYTTIFKRVALFGSIAFIFVLTPNTIWVELKYRNQPALRDAIMRAIENPNDQELWDAVDYEREKVNREE